MNWGGTLMTLRDEIGFDDPKRLRMGSFRVSDTLRKLPRELGAIPLGSSFELRDRQETPLRRESRSIGAADSPNRGTRVRPAASSPTGNREGTRHISNSRGRPGPPPRLTSWWNRDRSSADCGRWHWLWSVSLRVSPPVFSAH